MLGEGRWVEDDQVVFVFDVLEVLHGIGGRFRKVGLRAEVEFHVFRGQHDGAFRRVHRADLLGAPSHGIDREAPRVAEGVEHRAPLRVAFDQLPVFALVEEEPGFLPLLPVDEKFLAVLRHHVRRMVGASPQVSVHSTQPGVEGYGLRTFVVDGRDAVAVGSQDRPRNILAGKVHADGVALDDGHRAVDVHHEPRQPVAFAVDEAVAVRVGVVRESERAPYVVGHGDAPVPPGLVDRFLVECKHAHGDRADLIVSQGDEIARAGIYFDQGTFRDFRFVFGLDVVDGARENPRVAAHERFFLAFAQVYLGCHNSGCLIWGV